MAKNTDILLNRVDMLSHRFIKIYEQKEENKFKRIKSLSKTEISILRLLCENPEKIMRDISQDLHISKSSLTGIIDHLEARGYLLRIMSKRDRRSYGLEVTKEGKLAQLEHIKWEKEAYIELIAALQANDAVDTYLDLTEKILNSLEKGSDKPIIPKKEKI